MPNFRVKLARDQDLYVHHHLGLGDMIHCNGLVRSLLEELQERKNLYLFCRERFTSMVEWMYRDEARIKILPIDDQKREHPEIRRILQKHKSTNFLSVGHRSLKHLEVRHPHLFFDQLFYLQLDLPYEYRFSKCYWRRDMDEEERVFRKLAPQTPFAFVHDDPLRGLVVNTDSIHLPIVRNDLSESIFHLGLLLERATEIHCMESSIRCMMESLELNRNKLYYHNFRCTRPLGTATRQKWIEVRYELATPAGTPV
jgi:hypothetical protein